MIIKILAIVITLGIFLTPTMIGVLDAWPGENDKENHSKTDCLSDKDQTSNQ